jgi:hypothetical protein
MTIETIALAGFVFAAAALAALVYERRMDVLYGPYIEGRSGRAGTSIERFWTPMRSAADYFRWKAGIFSCLAVMIAC